MEVGDIAWDRKMETFRMSFARAWAGRHDPILGDAFRNALRSNIRGQRQTLARIAAERKEKADA